MGEDYVLPSLVVGSKFNQDIVVPRQDAQSSTTLLASVVAPGFALTGQETPIPGQVPSLTSTNNFINFCSTVPNLPLTDGKQLSSGSCNPAPMGHIPSPDSMPSAKFTAPRNGDIIEENTSFSLAINTRNFNTGVSVTPQSNFLSAPQQLSEGSINGNYHLVVEEIASIEQPTLTDPRVFTFFKLLLDPTVATVITNGLPAGFYRATATVHAANHQPVLVPRTQHGSLNDAVYFTVISNSTASRELNDSGHLLRVSTSPSQSPKPCSDAHLQTRERRKRVFKRQSGSDQTSMTLNSSVICSGFANDGQSTAQPGPSSSLTSTNNFINYCASLPGVPLTNGQQLPSDSCNPAPMGILPSPQNMPSARFIFPTFNTTISENMPFTVTLAIGNIQTGSFVNPATNFLAAPQQLSENGLILGYSAIVIEEMTSLNQVSPTDPRIFAFFKGLNSPVVNSQLTANITTGLPAGVYRLSSIVSAANHQPVLTPVNQHGSVDDIVYFSVVATNGTPAPTTSSSSASSISSTPSTPAATPSQSATTRTPVPVGAIAGVGVASVVILLALVLSFFVWRRRKAGKKIEDTLEQPYPDLTPFMDAPRPDTSHSAPLVQEVQNSKPGTATTTYHFPPPPPSPSPRPSGKVIGPRSRSTRSRVSVISSAPSYHTTIERLPTTPSD